MATADELEVVKEIQVCTNSFEPARTAHTNGRNSSQTTSLSTTHISHSPKRLWRMEARVLPT